MTFPERLRDFRQRRAELAEYGGTDQDVARFFREWAILEKRIALIPDSETRLLITLHYIEGWPWERVGKYLNVDASGLQKRCRRYLRRCQPAPVKGL